MEGVEKPKEPKLPPVEIPEEVLRAVFSRWNPKRPLRNYPPKKWRTLALRNTAILDVLLDSMVRNAELRGLGADDLDFRDGLITVRYAKGGDVRRVPFSTETARALKTWLDERQRRFRLPPDRGVLFIDLSGRPLSKNALRQIFRSVKQAIGYEGRFFPHAVRHTSAKVARRAGADLLQLARVLGHKSLVMTRRYSEPDDEEIARAHRLWSPVSRLMRGR